MGKTSIQIHFSHMRFIEKTDCKLSVSNGSVNAVSIYKMQSIFLLTLDFAADSFRCS